METGQNLDTLIWFRRFDPRTRLVFFSSHGNGLRLVTHSLNKFPLHRERSQRAHKVTLNSHSLSHNTYWLTDLSVSSCDSYPNISCALRERERKRIHLYFVKMTREWWLRRSFWCGWPAMWRRLTLFVREDNYMLIQSNNFISLFPLLCCWFFLQWRKQLQLNMTHQ